MRACSDQPEIFSRAAAILLLAGFTGAQSLPEVTGVELQPLAAQVQRVVQALELAGAPLEAERVRALNAAFDAPSKAESVLAIQRALDPLCIALVNVNPESRVKVAAGPTPPELVQKGWRHFLVKVHNEAGVTARLACSSPNAEPMVTPSTNAADPKPSISEADLLHRWLDVRLNERAPLSARLSGLALEYRIIELYSRDAGKREAKLAFDVGQGTQDLGFRNEVNVLFRVEPAVLVTLEVLDAGGAPTMAEFVFRDAKGRVYPARSRRLAPDFFFHDQVYRADGETISLAPGDYEVTWSRGPEYVARSRTITVPAAKTHSESFQLERWIDMAALGWFSGDHHVHAAGCSHYESPTEGVGPEDMMRHILGEDLKVACVLSWGPCWYFQKDFFEGGTNALSTAEHIMRYDVEVSGFPSSHAGHLCLLGLTEDDYPGTERIEEWPSWDLPVLEWAKRQGAVVGFSHSGWGLAVDGTEVPSFDMPNFDGIGANEYVVDVTHGACDFISTVDTPVVWELSIWYHTLNCGFTTRISGETDFPCIYGERLGLGRSYVRLGADEPLSFERWVEGIRDGRAYVSDGTSHLFDFEVGGLAVGDAGADGRPSVLALASGATAQVRAKVAARLGETPRPELARRPLSDQPYWHLERARIGDTRTVRVELIVNGTTVATRTIEADGSVHELEFEFTPERSSWVALRILPSSHTNPIFIEQGGRPIRASKRSAEWCRRAVDVCWDSKRGNIKKSEREAAEAAYDHAREAYERIARESIE